MWLRLDVTKYFMGNILKSKIKETNSFISLLSAYISNPLALACRSITLFNIPENFISWSYLRKKPSVLYYDLYHIVHGHCYTLFIVGIHRHNTYSKTVAFLTQWGRVTLRCVGKLVIICSDNGFSPIRHQAITWTNADLLSIGLLGTYFSEIWIWILSFSFKKMQLKMSSANCRRFCLGLNVLTKVH